MEPENSDKHQTTDWLADLAYECPPEAAMPAPAATAPKTTTPKAPAVPPRVDTQHGADFLRDQAFAVFMSGAVDRSLAERLPITSFETYHTRLLKDLGDPSDPIVRMTAEQIVVAHFSYLGLQVRAAHSKSYEECSVLGTTACHVMAEFRRSAASLHEMCQGLATAKADRSRGSPEAQMDGGEAAKPAKAGNHELPAKKASRTELESKATQEQCDERAAATVPFKEPAARRRRKAKSA